MLFIVVLTAGCIGLDGMPLNHFSGSALLISVGLAIEDTLHLGITFLNGKGSAEERVKMALSEMVQPMCDGSISTLLSLVSAPATPLCA